MGDTHRCVSPDVQPNPALEQTPGNTEIDQAYGHVAADDGDDVACLRHNVDRVRHHDLSSTAALNSMVRHVTRGLADDPESHPMPHGAVDDHRTAVQNLHPQCAGPDTGNQLERQLLADHARRPTDGQEFGLRCPTDGDVAKDSHRTRPCLSERKPWMGTSTDHLSPCCL